MTAALELSRLLPRDDPAEARLAAIAILSQRGADLAYDHGVNPEHFYNPLYGRLFATASTCTAYGIDERRAAIAAATHVALSQLDELEQLPRIAIVDEHGHYSGRVIDAANGRARVMKLLDELEQTAGPLHTAIVETVDA